MLLSIILDPVVDLIGDMVLLWDKSDTERVKSIQRARNKVLESHDDLMLDSTKKHILLCTNAGLYLVSRHRAWKTKLTDKDIALYAKRGRRAFSRIERNRS